MQDAGIVAEHRCLLSHIQLAGEHVVPLDGGRLQMLPLVVGSWRLLQRKLTVDFRRKTHLVVDFLVTNGQQLLNVEHCVFPLAIFLVLR